MGLPPPLLPGFLIHHNVRLSLFAPLSQALAPTPRMDRSWHDNFQLSKSPPDQDSNLVKIITPRPVFSGQSPVSLWYGNQNTHPKANSCGQTSHPVVIDNRLSQSSSVHIPPPQRTLSEKSPMILTY